MRQQLAIIGDFTRGNEVIELLEMLGGVNGKINKNTGKVYNIYNGNYFIPEIGRVREVAYYIDFTSQIRRIDIKDITSHFIVYSLDRFLKQYPFKVGDKVILDNKLCSIIWMCWECNNIYYQIQGIDDIFTKKVTANELKPYKKQI